MKKTLSALFIALAAFTASASAQEAKVVTGKIRCSENSEIILPKGQKFLMKDFGTQKSFTPIRHNKAAAEGETSTLLITADKRPVDAMIFNKDYSKELEFTRKECNMAIPKGVYDLYVEIYDDNGVAHFVFKENVDLTQDQNITINHTEADIPVEFHFFDENNQELHMNITEDQKVVIPKTADDMVKLYSIIHKDYGPTKRMMDFAARKKGYLMDFYINNVSDKYYVGEVVAAGVGSHYYAYKAVMSDFTKNVYNSDPANLFKLASEFTTSPAMNDDYINQPGIEAAFSCDGYAYTYSRLWGGKDVRDEGKIITFIDCPESKLTDEYKVNMLARPMATDYYVLSDDPDYGESISFSYIKAPAAFGNAKEGVKFMVSGGDLYDEFNVPVGETNYKYYPGHPEFSFEATDGKAHFGNSVPVMAYNSVRETYEDEVDVYDSYSYRGRYGELREPDASLVDYNEEATADGTIVTLKNSNVKVDGIDGKNISVVKYDITKQDNTAPTLQMLTFKDVQGNICDHLDSNLGAKMIFAGGDFNYVENPDYPYIGHYTCSAPESVKAFYAPHGTEDWVAIPLKEDPEKFFMPAFGHFYEVNLSDVKAEGKDIWFDVRVEMSDATGNYQKQTISPAFKVATIAAIDQAKAAVGSSLVVMGKRVSLAGNDMADFTVRSIDGRTMQNVHANGVDLGGMISGVYVVTAVMADGNVLSAKVAL